MIINCVSAELSVPSALGINFFHIDFSPLSRADCKCTRYIGSEWRMESTWNMDFIMTENWKPFKEFYWTLFISFNFTEFQIENTFKKWPTNTNYVIVILCTPFTKTISTFLLFQYRLGYCNRITIWLLLFIVLFFNQFCSGICTTTNSIFIVQKTRLHNHGFHELNKNRRKNNDLRLHREQKTISISGILTIFIWDIFHYPK